MDEVKFVPILNQKKDGCTCNLLTVAGINILLECGCPEYLASGNLKELFAKKLAHHFSNIHVALLSHEFVDYIGYVPLLAKLASKDCVILTTSPVCKLGHLTLYDFIYSRGFIELFDLFTLEQVDSVFDSMKTLKYKEKFIFKTQEGDKIRFVPLPSGGTIGGVVWKIRYKLLRILYIPRPYMKSEIISDGLSLQELPILADLVLIDSNARQEVSKVKENKREIKKLVKDHMKVSGTVIIPCDSGSRGLELLSSLKRSLEKEQENTTPPPNILYMHTMSDRALEVARSHIEWMSLKVSTIENKSNESEFIENGRLKCLTSIAELGKIPIEGGKLIFCTSRSLDYGLGYYLLRRFIEDPNVLFLFPFTPIKSELGLALLHNEFGMPIAFPVTDRTRIASPKKLPEVNVEPVAEPIPQIQIKANVVKQVKPLFKGKAFLCFEDVKPKKKSDGFGDIITEEEKFEWKRLNLGESLSSPIQDMKRAQEDNKTIIPRLRKPFYSGIFTYSYKTMYLVPRAKFRLINFDGICDKLSLRLIVRYLKPKRLILLNNDNTQELSLKVLHKLIIGTTRKRRSS